MRHARIAANRIFAVENFRMPLLHLADLARRELRAGVNPGPALLDSLALAAIAAQRTLGLRAHLAQMCAAVLALQDRTAELACGEGKTLALALAAAVRALGGMPVHLVVRDDALAPATARQMKPFFEALGLAVAAVCRASDDAARREAYQADICYATADELMTDDLRNRIAAERIGFRPSERACALVDDIDGVLIDGAVTTTAQFFNRYARLGGVSATLSEARTELASVYGLGVTAVASIYPCFRRELGLTVYAGAAAWRRAVVGRVQALVAARRPVLIVTATEAASRAMVPVLLEVGIDASVMPAGSHADWCSVRDTAGRPGAVTLCAARPGHCDAVALDPLARSAGGLAVIATYLGATRRADRQLGHLTGRQAQPGSVESIVQFCASGGLAWLPMPVMRSLVLSRRYLGELRAARERSRQARRLSGRRAHLQHEGR